MNTVIESNLYNFAISPANGAMREVEDYIIIEEGGEYFLSPTSSTALKSVPISMIDRPFNEQNMWRFSLKALYYPLLVILLLFLSAAFMARSLSSDNLLIVGSLYALYISDVLYTTHLLKTYTGGMKTFIKDDFYKVLFLFLSLLGLIYYALNSNNFGYVEVSLISILLMWYYIYLESIKKPLLYILSKNVQYWEYKIEGGKRAMTFYALSPKVKQVKGGGK